VEIEVDSIRGILRRARRDMVCCRSVFRDDSRSFRVMVDDRRDCGIVNEESNLMKQWTFELGGE
jgi:hypothetical protein